MPSEKGRACRYLCRRYHWGFQISGIQSCLLSSFQLTLGLLDALVYLCTLRALDALFQEVQRMLLQLQFLLQPTAKTCEGISTSCFRLYNNAKKNTRKWKLRQCSCQQSWSSLDATFLFIVQFFKWTRYYQTLGPWSRSRASLLLHKKCYPGSRCYARATSDHVASIKVLANKLWGNAWRSGKPSNTYWIDLLLLLLGSAGHGFQCSLCLVEGILVDIQFCLGLWESMQPLQQRVAYIPWATWRKLPVFSDVFRETGLMD